MGVRKIGERISAISTNGTELFVGTENGTVIHLHGGNPDSAVTIFNDSGNRRVVDLSSRGSGSDMETAVVVEGEVEDPDEGVLWGTDAFLVKQSGTVHMDAFVSKLLTPRCMLQFENQFFSVFFPEIGELRPIYSLEFFMNTKVFDFDGKHTLAINRSMMSATIYTIDLTAKKSVEENDTFSFEGRYLSQIGSDDHESGGTFDNLCEEELRNERAFHRMIDPSLVLEAHNPRTCLDFVKIVPRTNAESLIVSGGRDGKVVVSTVFSHRKCAEIDCRCVPRCCVYDGRRYVYFGCDSGRIGRIDMHDSSYSCRFYEIGEERFGLLHLSNGGGRLVALNSDNVLLVLDTADMSVISMEEYEERVLDFQAPDEMSVVVLTENGTLFLQKRTVPVLNEG